jgi:uncharacterized protein YndB with AHSA1/START domain
MIEHATFTAERVYDASPERTFAAWSDPVAKARWYSDPEQELELDFRVGGWEGAFFDGHEAPARREHGIGGLLDLLGRSLRQS